MRRTGLFPPASAILVAILVLAAPGCAKKGNKLLGNERLSRGPGGLGTTTSAIYVPDRDTYVTPGDPNYGSTLIVGMTGAFESRAFFKPTSWTLPDTTDASLIVTSIFFEASFDASVSIPIDLSLILARTNDTLTVNPGATPATYPGPAPATTFGTGNTGQIAPFRIQMATSLFDSIKTWAKYPTAFRGFVLYASGGNDVVGFQAGKAAIKIVYQHTVSGLVKTDTDSTAITLDYTLHSPAAPLASGSDAMLRLGGLYEWGVPLHFSPAAVPEGSTVNEATLLLRVDTTGPSFASSVDVDLEVRNLPQAWAESITDSLSLWAGTTILASRAKVFVRSAADSVIAIPLPETIIRRWTTAGAVNEGIFITMKNGNLVPEIRLNSRESSNPIVLRVRTTSPPPGRF